MRAKSWPNLSETKTWTGNKRIFNDASSPASGHSLYIDLRESRSCGKHRGTLWRIYIEPSMGTSARAVIGVVLGEFVIWRSPAIQASTPEGEISPSRKSLTPKLENLFRFCELSFTASLTAFTGAFGGVSWAFHGINLVEAVASNLPTFPSVPLGWATHQPTNFTFSVAGLTQGIATLTAYNTLIEKWELTSGGTNLFTFNILLGSEVRTFVPEPSTAPLAGLGLLALSGYAAHRRARRHTRRT